MTEQSTQNSTEKTEQLLKSIKQTAYKIEQVSATTANQLHNQGQKMDGIERTVDTIDREVNKTRRLSRHLYSWWYYVKDKIVGNDQEKGQREGKEGKKQQKSQNTNTNGNNQIGLQMREQNQHYDEVLNTLRRAKNTMKATGDELSKQNSQIDRINNKSDKVQEKMDYSNKLLKKI